MAVIHHMMHMLGDILKPDQTVPIPAHGLKMIAERIDFLESQIEYYKNKEQTHS